MEDSLGSPEFGSPTNLPLSELVTWASTVPPHYDEPKVWVTVAQLRLNRYRSQVRLRRGDEAEYGYSGGAAVRLDTSLIALFGESAERFALLPRRATDPLVRFEDLDQERALAPQKIVAGSKTHPPARSHLPFRWTLGRSIIFGTERLIPQQLVDVPYFYSHGEAIVRSPITTGAAAGRSLEDCTTRGLLEVIERDAFMLAWLSRARLKSLPVASSYYRSRSALHFLSRECLSSGLSVELRLLPSTFPVNVVAAFVFDDSDCGPKLTVGASASFDREEAASKALLEALQLRVWLRGDRARLTSSRLARQPLNTPVRTMRQRASLLFRKDYADAIRCWIEDTEMSAAAQSQEPTISCIQLAKIAESQNCTATVVDLTERLPPKVRDTGLHVAKVVVPELQPLWLNDSARDIAWTRLERYSKLYGTQPCDNQNSTPHPFL